MNVYLDIDGVILANDKQPALHVAKFVEHIVSRFPVYWLTTHVRHDGDDPLPMLARFLDEQTMELLGKVKPTEWDMLKTEAIDFSQDFRWFDDQILQSEEEVLRRQNALTYFVQIDLRKNPNQLHKIISSPPW